MRDVIIVTDGDCKALEAIEAASRNVGARCISISACRHPEDAYWTPQEIEELILSTPRDPVVVLVDDEGKEGKGRGEEILSHLILSDRIDVKGVVAVASNMQEGRGVKVDVSVTADGEVIGGPVDKEGQKDEQSDLHGDTVEVLDKLRVPLVVGLGDPGKMNFADEARRGAPVTTKALELILKNGEHRARALATGKTGETGKK